MEILFAVLILGGLGLAFGLVLAAASKVFYVETDPRLDQLNECLPGANCGGCGFAGCGAYADTECGYDLCFCNICIFADEVSHSYLGQVHNHVVIRELMHYIPAAVFNSHRENALVGAYYIFSARRRHCFPQRWITNYLNIASGLRCHQERRVAV